MSSLKKFLSFFWKLKKGYLSISIDFRNTLTIPLDNLIKAIGINRGKQKNGNK